MANNFYNEILTEHNVRPEFKYDLPDATIKLEGVNPNCGDDIFLNLKVEDGVIQDASFCGDGCAISQASADIGMIVGKTKEEALHLSDLFLKMIKGTATEEEVDELEEASALQDISHMPARVKCAVLGWRTLREALEKLQLNDASLSFEWQALMLEIQEERQTLQENGLIPTEQENSEK